MLCLLDVPYHWAMFGNIGESILKQWIDISFPYYEGMAIYPGNPPYQRAVVQDVSKGDSATISQIAMGTHTGTHIDAPLHVFENGKSVDQIPLERMNGRARLLDLCGIEQIGVEQLKDAKLCVDDIVLLKTDNTQRFQGVHVLSDYVTLTYDAAEYLANIGIKMVGIDYMTIERPRGKRIDGKSIHRTLLGAEIVIVEGLDFRYVTEGEYDLFCFPLCLKGADGAPARVVLTA